MKALSCLIAVLLCAVSCFAADVDGKWTGSISTPNGDLPVSFVFKADGATLTGTTTGPDGSEVKIANGKVDGKNITFAVTFDFGGNGVTINYKGVVDMGQIKLTADFNGMPFELTVKKAS
jgi:hypothetical protein